MPHPSHSLSFDHGDAHRSWIGVSLHFSTDKVRARNVATSLPLWRTQSAPTLFCSATKQPSFRQKANHEPHCTHSRRRMSSGSTVTPQGPTQPPLPGSRRTSLLSSSRVAVMFAPLFVSGVPRGGVWGVHPHAPKIRRPSKIVPNSTRLWKMLKISEFRTPTPQDVREKGSKILKLPRFAIVLH